MPFPLLRFIALLLIPCLIADPVTAAAFVHGEEANPCPVKIPARWGRVTEVCDARSRLQAAGNSKLFPRTLSLEPRAPLIVLIQDLHANVGVQRNIAEIIKYVASKQLLLQAPGSRLRRLFRAYSLEPRAPLTVFLEGAVGPFDVSILRNVKNKRIQRKAIDHFLGEAKLLGSEIAAIESKSPLHLWGVDDRALYIRNLQAFYRASLKSPVPHPKHPAWQDYYEIAKQRDIPLALHALEHWDLLNQTAAPPQVVGLVAGGYHTEGITRLLKAQQVPYVVVTPVVDSLGNERLHAQRLRELARTARQHTLVAMAILAIALIIPDASHAMGGTSEIASYLATSSSPSHEGVEAAMQAVALSVKPATGGLSKSLGRWLLTGSILAVTLLTIGGVFQNGGEGRKKEPLTPEHKDILFNIDRGVATITFNRPPVNAMTLEMIREIRRLIDQIKNRNDVKVILFKSADGMKHFGAGADILQLRDHILQGHPEKADEFYTEEYALYNDIAELTIPTVSLANRTMMGSFLGLAMTGVIVATKESKLAMPETKLGFIPDVGATKLLADRVGAPLAKVLGLTSKALNGVEAFRYGLADAYTSDKTLPDLESAIKDYAETHPRVEPDKLKNVIGRFNVPAKGSIVSKDVYRKLFKFETFEAILAALQEAVQRNEGLEAQIAQEALRRMELRSPIGLHVTNYLMNVNSKRTLKQTFDQELIAAKALSRYPDYPVGVEAVLLKKTADTVRPPFIGDMRHVDYALLSQMVGHEVKPKVESLEEAQKAVEDPYLIHGKEDWDKIQEAYRADPDGFWLRRAHQELEWFKKPTKGIREQVDDQGHFSFTYFEDGELNASYEILDRQVNRGMGDQPAYTWISDPADGEGNAEEVKTITYQELLAMVEKFANALTGMGVKKGDGVTLYTASNTIEAKVARFAAMRIGAIFTPVFPGLSAQELSDRAHQINTKVVLTVNGGYRKGQLEKYKEEVVDKAFEEYIPKETAIEFLKNAILQAGVTGDQATQVLQQTSVQLKEVITIHYSTLAKILDTVLEQAQVGDVERVAASRSIRDQTDQMSSRVNKIVVIERARRQDCSVEMKAGRDIYFNDALKEMELQGKTTFNPVHLPAEHPLFVIFTSGSQGKPKGTYHTTGGYLTNISYSMKFAWGVQPGERIFVAADDGWITGNSAMSDAPLMNGMHSFLYEGLPNWPTPDRIWKILAENRIHYYKTGVTAVRDFSKGDVSLITKWRDKGLNTLKASCSCAEPLYPYVQSFWEQVILGGDRRKFANFFWRTEDGMFSPFIPHPDGRPQKSDASTVASPWGEVKVLVLNKDADENIVGLREARSGEVGSAFIRHHPSMIRGLWKNPDRFRDTYWPTAVVIDGKRWHKVGDAAKMDEEGYITFLGRDDEVINVSGHRIGTQEIESLVGAVEEVKLSSVVGIPHLIKGETPVAFVILKDGITPTVDLDTKIRKAVEEGKGKIARPEEIFYVTDLPQTMSKKIFRRFLEQIAAMSRAELADVYRQLKDNKEIHNKAIKKDEATLIHLFGEKLAQTVQSLPEGPGGTHGLIAAVYGVAEKREIGKVEHRGIQAGDPYEVDFAMYLPSEAQEHLALLFRSHGYGTPELVARAKQHYEIVRRLTREAQRKKVDPEKHLQERMATMGYSPTDIKAACLEFDMVKTFREQVLQRLIDQGLLWPLGKSFVPGEELPPYMFAWAIVKDRWGRPVYGQPEDVLYEIIAPTPQAGPNDVVGYTLYAGVTRNIVAAGEDSTVGGFNFHNQDHHISGSDGVFVTVHVGSEVEKAGITRVGEIFNSYSGEAGLLDYRMGYDPMATIDFKIKGYQTPDGTMAQFARFQGPQVLHKPPELTLEEASSYSLDLGTVYKAMVDRAKARKGEIGYVEGGAGGTGHFASEVLHMMGVDVTTLVSSKERGRFTLERGAKHFINRKDSRFDALWQVVPHPTKEPQKYAEWAQAVEAFKEEFQKLNNGRLPNVINASVGRPTFAANVDLLADRGRLAYYGADKGFTLSFRGKKGSRSASEAYDKNDLIPGKGVLIYYGAGADDEAIDLVGLEAIEEALARKARVVVLANTVGQQIYLQNRFGDRLTGIESIENLKTNPSFEWPHEMPDLDTMDANGKVTVDNDKLYYYQEHTLKIIGSQIGRFFKTSDNPAGFPDVIVERAGQNSLGVSAWMVRPMTGRVIYLEDTADQRFMFYAPHVWFTQKTIDFPTFAILGTHLSNSFQANEVNRKIETGQLKMKDPKVFGWPDALAAVQELVEGTVMGTNAIRVGAPPVPHLKNEEDLGSHWKIKVRQFGSVKVTTYEVAPNQTIAKVTLKGDNSNALNTSMVKSLGYAVDYIVQDPKIQAVVITSGDNKSFSSGADIKEMQSEIVDRTDGIELAQLAQGIYNQLESMKIPVVAAINGFALGGGLELAMSTHYRVASAKAEFGQPEIALKIMPGFGGTQRLPRLLQVKKKDRGLIEAAKIILNGRRISAYKAEELGLVEEVAETDALSRAMALALEHVRTHNGTLAEAMAHRHKQIEDWDIPNPGEATRIKAVIEGNQEIQSIITQNGKMGRKNSVTRALDAIFTGFAEGITAGLAAEAQAFGELIVSPVDGRLGIDQFVRKQQDPLSPYGVIGPNKIPRQSFAPAEAVIAGLVPLALLGLFHLATEHHVPVPVLAGGLAGSAFLLLSGLLAQLTMWQFIPTLLRLNRFLVRKGIIRAGPYELQGLFKQAAPDSTARFIEVQWSPTGQPYLAINDQLLAFIQKLHPKLQAILSGFLHLLLIPFHEGLHMSMAKPKNDWHRIRNEAAVYGVTLLVIGGGVAFSGMLGGMAALLVAIGVGILNMNRTLQDRFEPPYLTAKRSPSDPALSKDEGETIDQLIRQKIEEGASTPLEKTLRAQVLRILKRSGRHKVIIQAFEKNEIPINVIDLGEERGFPRRPNSGFGSLYERPTRVGSRITAVNVTKAFVEDNRNDPQVIEQIYFHPLSEDLPPEEERLTHTEANNEEAKSNSKETQGDILSDLNRYILRDRARRGDWEYLERFQKDDFVLSEHVRSQISRRFPGNPEKVNQVEADAIKLGHAMSAEAKELLKRRPPVLKEPVSPQAPLPAKGRLAGKKIVITGAAGEIGSDVTRRFLEEGATVILVGRTLSKLKATIEELSKLDFPAERMHAVAIDISVPQNVDGGWKYIYETFGLVDGLENVAGTAGRNETLTETSTDENSDENIQKATDNLFSGDWLMTTAAIPYLKDGSCVNMVGSIFSLTDYYARAPYVMGKSGLNGLTWPLVQEMGRSKRLRVNLVLPGGVDSDRIRGVWRTMDEKMGANPGTTARMFFERMALNRQKIDSKASREFVQRREVADALVLLASDESEGLSGQSVEITNGMQVQRESRATLYGSPSLQGADFSDKAVLIIGDGVEEMTSLADAYKKLNAEVILAPGSESVSSVLQTRNSASSIVLTDTTKAPQVRELFERIRQFDKPLVAVVSLPQYDLPTGPLTHTGPLTFGQQHLASQAIVAKEAALYWEERDASLTSAPQLVLVSPPEQGPLAEARRRGLEALLRQVRFESGRKKARETIKHDLWPYQLVRTPHASLQQMINWTLGLTCQSHKMAEINLSLPVSASSDVTTPHVQSTTLDLLNAEVKEPQGPLRQGERLKGKVAVITGTTGTSARSITRRYLEEGASVILVGPHIVELSAITAAYQTFGVPAERMMVIQADPSQPDQAIQAVKQIFTRFSNIDILVNDVVSDMLKGSDKLEEAMHQFVTSNWIQTYIYTSLMKPGGSVINTSSLFAFMPAAGLGHYSYLLAAINNLTNRLAWSLGHNAGLRVNQIVPGLTDSQETREAVKAIDTDRGVPFGSTAQKIFDLMSLPPQWVSPERVADLAVYLGSEESMGTAAQSFEITNGMPLRRESRTVLQGQPPSDLSYKGKTVLLVGHNDANNALVQMAKAYSDQQASVLVLTDRSHADSLAGVSARLLTANLTDSEDICQALSQIGSPHNHLDAIVMLTEAEQLTHQKLVTHGVVASQIKEFLQKSPSTSSKPTHWIFVGDAASPEGFQSGTRSAIETLIRGIREERSVWPYQLVPQGDTGKLIDWTLALTAQQRDQRISEINLYIPTPPVTSIHEEEIDIETPLLTYNNVPGINDQLRPLPPDLHKDEVIIITGGSRGMGKATALAFLKSGARAVVLTARNPGDLKAAKEELSQLGYQDDQVLPVSMDVTLERDLKRVIQQTIATYGRLDGIFINAAGTGPTAPIVRVPPGRNELLIPFTGRAEYPGSDGVKVDDWMETFDSNLISGLILMREALPHMKKRKRGWFAANSSFFGGKLPFPRPYNLRSAYGTAKRSMIELAEMVAPYLGKYGLRINDVAPGPVWGTRLKGTNIYRPPLYNKRAEGYWTIGVPVTPESIEKKTLSEIPDGKMPTEAEIAWHVAMMTADPTHTGQTLYAAKGLRLKNENPYSDAVGHPPIKALQQLRGKVALILADRSTLEPIATIARTLAAKGTDVIVQFRTDLRQEFQDLMAQQPRANARRSSLKLGRITVEVMGPLQKQADEARIGEKRIRDIMTHHGRLDIVISAPQYDIPDKSLLNVENPAAGMTKEDMKEQVHRQLTQHLIVAREAIAAMRENPNGQEGAILFIAPPTTAKSTPMQRDHALYWSDVLTSFTLTLAEEERAKDSGNARQARLIQEKLLPEAQRIMEAARAELEQAQTGKQTDGLSIPDLGTALAEAKQRVGQLEADLANAQERLRHPVRVNQLNLASLSADKEPKTNNERQAWNESVARAVLLTTAEPITQPELQSKSDYGTWKTGKIYRPAPGSGDIYSGSMKSGPLALAAGIIAAAILFQWPLWTVYAAILLGLSGTVFLMRMESRSHVSVEPGIDSKSKSQRKSNDHDGDDGAFTVDGKAPSRAQSHLIDLVLGIIFNPASADKLLTREERDALKPLRRRVRKWAHEEMLSNDRKGWLTQRFKNRDALRDWSEKIITDKRKLLTPVMLDRWNEGLTHGKWLLQELKERYGITLKPASEYLIKDPQMYKQIDPEEKLAHLKWKIWVDAKGQRVPNLKLTKEILGGGDFKTEKGTMALITDEEHLANGDTLVGEITGAHLYDFQEVFEPIMNLIYDLPEVQRHMRAQIKTRWGQRKTEIDDDLLKQLMAKPTNVMINASNKYGGQLYLLGHKKLLNEMPASLRAWIADHEGLHLERPSMPEREVKRLAPYDEAVRWAQWWLLLNQYHKDPGNLTTQQNIAAALQPCLQPLENLSPDEKTIVEQLQTTFRRSGVERLEVVDVPYWVGETEKGLTWTHSIVLGQEGRKTLYMQRELINELLQISEQEAPTALQMIAALGEHEIDWSEKRDLSLPKALETLGDRAAQRVYERLKTKVTTFLNGHRQMRAYLHPGLNSIFHVIGELLFPNNPRWANTFGWTGFFLVELPLLALFAMSAWPTTLGDALTVPLLGEPIQWLSRPLGVVIGLAAFALFHRLLRAWVIYRRTGQWALDLTHFRPQLTALLPYVGIAFASGVWLIPTVSFAFWNHWRYDRALLGPLWQSSPKTEAGSPAGWFSALSSARSA